MKRISTILLIAALLCVSLFLVSCSEKYAAQDGGRIERVGDSEIRAISDNGYRFVGWSDGESSATRAYEKKNRKEKITACFEPICVELYDGDALTSILPLCDIDLAYAASDGTYVIGYVSQSAAEKLSLDPTLELVSQLKALYETDGIRDAEDIMLHAVYIYYEAERGGELRHLV